MWDDIATIRKMPDGYKTSQPNLQSVLGVIQKRQLLRGGVKNVGSNLVKRRQKGREGGHKMGRRCLWMAP